MTVRRVLFWLAVAALAVPAVPLTLNRLVDSSSGPAIRIMSFTPLATPWYVVEVLLLGVALVAGWAGPRKVVAPVLAVFVAGLGLHLWWLAPQYLGDNPAPDEDAEQRVVMNLNLYEGRADGADVVRIAKDRDVSVLVLQEITFRALHELEDNGIDDLLPYRIGEPNGAVDGTMVFAREPLGPAVKLDTVFQSWQVVVGEGEEALTLVAAHPRAPVPPGSASSMLAEHAVLLEAAQRSEADLVLGDMNATYDHAPMRAWRDAGWRDSLELVNAGWSRTWPANGITPAPGVHPPALIQIDHVLLGPRMAVTDSETIGVAGTDHLAVVATVARR